MTSTNARSGHMEVDVDTSLNVNTTLNLDAHGLVISELVIA
jgi:hypothetical protein